MDMETRVGRKPPADARRFVRPVVVENEMDVELGRHARVDCLEELQELLTAMSPMALTNDFSRGDIERRKERGRAVPSVVMRAPLGDPGLERENRGASIQRLNLTLFIDAEHERAIRWIEIQPDDVADLLDKLRIFREFERLDAMRLQPERAPNPRNRRLTEAPSTACSNA